MSSGYDHRSPVVTRAEFADVTARVEKLEQAQMDSIGALAKLTRAVGEPATASSEATGMIKDLSELKNSLGWEPNEVLKTPGKGLANTMHETLRLLREREIAQNTADAVAAQNASRPGERMRVIKNIGVILSVIISTGTLLTGCLAASTYFIRQTVHNTVQITSAH